MTWAQQMNRQQTSMYVGIYNCIDIDIHILYGNVHTDTVLLFIYFWHMATDHKI